MARLADAVETLSAVARRAPILTNDAGRPAETEWYQLLDLAHDHLDRRVATPQPYCGDAPTSTFRL